MDNYLGDCRLTRANFGNAFECIKNLNGGRMQKSFTISLIGSSEIFREGMRRILLDAHFTISQSVNTLASLVDRSGDDILMIIESPRVAGDQRVPNYRRSISPLHARFPDMKIVVLSAVLEIEAMISAFRAGASGYLIHKIENEPLAASLKLIAMGQKMMPSVLADTLSDHFSFDCQPHGRTMPKLSRLSSREREILACLVMGEENKVIARQLSITDSTVKVHVKGILKKLQVKNRTQAAMLGINGGLQL